LYIDGTKVEANASLASLKPRFAVEAHLNTLFAPEAEQAAEEAEQATSQEEGSSNEAGAPEVKAPMRLPTSISAQEYEELSQGNAERHDWIEQLGAQNRSVTSGGYQRMADLRVSTTDPDAPLMETKHGSAMGYRTHSVVDGGKARIILAALVTPFEVTDNQPMLDLHRLARFRWKRWPRQATGDRKYGTEEHIVAIESQHIRASIPLPDNDHRTEFFSSQQFRYDAERAISICPAGKERHFWKLQTTERSRRWRARAKDGHHCPRHPPSVPPVHKAAACAAVWMRRCWIG
jgi:hypothetical protein